MGSYKLLSIVSDSYYHLISIKSKETREAEKII